jgi:phage protein U
MFLFLKHLVGGFCYRFWTNSWPKLKRKKKSDLPTLSESSREKATQVVGAIERYVNIAGIT